MSEKKSMLIQEDDVLKIINRHCVKPGDGTEEWRFCINDTIQEICDEIKALPSIPSKTDKCEYHTDHTDCIWYGNDSGCPATCSQYRDGWNDAMNYIFTDGKGYQPYRREEE